MGTGRLESEGEEREASAPGAREAPTEAERLREVTGLLDAIVDAIPHMVFLKDARELRFTRFNRAGEALLGLPRSEVVGKTDLDLFPQAEAERFRAKDRAVLRGGVAVDVAQEVVHTARGERWLHTRKVPLFDESGAPTFLLGISEDVTEQRDVKDKLRKAHEELEQRVLGRTAQLLVSNEELKSETHDRRQAEAALLESESQLRQAQKMEAIGRLAAGVAHDFNNLLSVIVGYAQLAASELPQESRARASLQEIHVAGLRAAELTKQLLAFGRKQVLLPRVVDLGEIIHDMARMLERIIGEDVALRLVAEPNLDLCRVDPHQVEQVVMNLVVNARDAMPMGGALTVTTTNVLVGEDFARAHHGIMAGPHVMLSVKDTGMGMDEATIARAFEPFFTTKESSRGTGLGLSTVFGIVEQSGGTIWLDSAVGRGTTVTVYFPTSADPAAATKAPSEPPPTRGHETVLLVEDDPQVRELLERLLEPEGYTTLPAASGADAIAIADAVRGQASQEIHLLLSDLVLHDMTGPEVAEAVSQAHPGIRVLFLSGYTESAMLHRGAWAHGMPFLEKPVTRDSLAAKVRQVLDGGGREPLVATAPAT